MGVCVCVIVKSADLENTKLLLVYLLYVSNVEWSCFHKYFCIKANANADANDNATCSTSLVLKYNLCMDYILLLFRYKNRYF